MVGDAKTIETQFAGIDGECLNVVAHTAFVAEEAFQRAFVDNFRKGKENDIEVAVVCRIVLELLQELFKLALVIPVKAYGEHAYIVALLYCL